MYGEGESGRTSRGMTVGLLWRICNYGILASTLFTFHDHACENEKLRISCPEGTTISVQHARYGRTQPSHAMCPYSAGGWHYNGPGKSDKYQEDTQCVSPKSLDVVLDKCQDRQRCRVLAAAQTFGEDPCPGTSKYLEIAYKCRPNEFRSRIICEGDSMSIQCDAKMKIAVYSAMFGRSQDSQDSCPAAPSYDHECQAECALETVLQRCHGRRQCRVDSSVRVFGDPCQPGTPKYLSVVYACVSRRILREIEADEVFTNSFCKDRVTVPPWDGGGGGGGGEGDGGISDGAPGYQPKPSIMSLTTPVRDQDHAYTVLPPGMTKEPVQVGEVREEETQAGRNYISDLFSAYGYISENEERFFLYVTLSVLVGVIFILLVIILRLALTRRRLEKRAKLDITEHVPSNGVTPPKTEPSRPEDMSLLSGSEDGNLSTDGIEMLSFHHHPSTFNRNHYSTTPKTFGTPNNNNNHNHTASRLHPTTIPQVPVTSSQTPVTSAYTAVPTSDTYSPPVSSATLGYGESLTPQFRITPNRTASLPRRYESQGSRPYDNYYR